MAVRWEGWTHVLVFKVIRVYNKVTPFSPGGGYHNFWTFTTFSIVTFKINICCMSYFTGVMRKIGAFIWYLTVIITPRLGNTVAIYHMTQSHEWRLHGLVLREWQPGTQIQALAGVAIFFCPELDCSSQWHFQLWNLAQGLLRDFDLDQKSHVCKHDLRPLIKITIWCNCTKLDE